jgi:hypothetical protein
LNDEERSAVMPKDMLQEYGPRGETQSNVCLDKILLFQELDLTLDE